MVHYTFKLRLVYYEHLRHVACSSDPLWNKVTRVLTSSLEETWNSKDTVRPEFSEFLTLTSVHPLLPDSVMEVSIGIKSEDTA
ncbi:hypothetical protein V2J09_018631 [Rumex salicifolius]